MPTAITRKLSQQMIMLQQQVITLVPSSLKSQWSALPVRDRNALKLLSGVLVLALIYLLLWQPVMQKIAAKERWKTQQSQRLERAQLAAYERLNQFGMIDLLPVEPWLTSELANYRLSLIQHQASNGPKQPGRLQLRYSDARKAQAFLLALSRFSQLSQIQVDQDQRTIALVYRLDTDYAELVQ